MKSHQKVVDLSLVMEISNVLRAPKLPTAISHHGVQTDPPSEQKNQGDPQKRPNCVSSQSRKNPKHQMDHAHVEDSLASRGMAQTANSPNSAKRIPQWFLINKFIEGMVPERGGV
jgi:hypothetical protein